ncbi:MAG: zinc ribbon domain-containing protein [Euryarchaeota archaeon]|nr:zinc ribbon domain-containing protein [Euryarchaeota archaeon]MBU4138771.1 zinc ribbon domain-containing protein [Euryarchaeota archaeon]
MTITKFARVAANPLNKPEEYGKNADGSHNNDYCGYCFKGGNFTNPNISMEK